MPCSRHSSAALSLAQDREDLRFGVSAGLHLNLLMHTAEKILLMQPRTFRGDYHSAVRHLGIDLGFALSISEKLDL